MNIVERLRRARERQGIDLEALERRIRVPVHLLEAVEQGRFEDLPRGLYARAIIRAYAEAVGVDTGRAIAEVAALLPGIEDPIDGLARVRGVKRPGPVTPPDSTEPSHIRHSAEAGWLATPAGPQLKRAAAAAIDGALLMAIHLTIVEVTAWTAGVSAGALFEFAAPALVALSVLIPGLYFLLLGGVAGETIGARLSGCVRPGYLAAKPSVVLWRAGSAAVAELSILVDLVFRYVDVPVSANDGASGERVTFGRGMRVPPVAIRNR